jgi:hypothetical protein
MINSGLQSAFESSSGHHLFFQHRPSGFAKDGKLLVADNVPWIGLNDLAYPLMRLPPLRAIRASIPINTTRAVVPLDAPELAGMPETYPFGL